MTHLGLDFVLDCAEQLGIDGTSSLVFFQLEQPIENLRFVRLEDRWVLERQPVHDLKVLLSIIGDDNVGFLHAQ